MGDIVMAGPYTKADGSDVPFVAFNKTDKYNTRQNGVFGSNPLMSPKYSKFAPRDAEFRDTLARLYIALPISGDPTRDAVVRQQYLDSLPKDGATQALANVLLNSAEGNGPGFIDFFLTAANEPFQEIMQVDKVLADDYVAFFYGQQPPVFQYSGTLLNSMQDDQRSGFAKAYQLMLRGTQLARRGALARLRYDSVIVTGVMVAQQQQLNADNELAVPFSFSFLVKEYVILQNAAFNRLTPKDYVQLASDTNITSLQSISTSTNPQVNTTAVTPQVPAATSTAGAAQPTSVIDQALNVMQQLVGHAATFLAGPSPSSNVKGTINPTAPTPPPAPSGNA
jgi:hypothetical protein